MKLILLFYLFFYLNILLHELSHVLMAKILKIPVERIAIGSERLSLKAGKFSLSLLPGGYVEVEEEALLKRRAVCIFLFFEAGPFSNLFLAAVLFFLIPHLAGLFASLVSAAFFLANNLFFLPKTDAGMIRTLLKRKFS